MHTIGVSDPELVTSPVCVRGWAVLGGAGLGLAFHATLLGPWLGPAGFAQAAIFGAILLAAAETDLRTGRIPNRLTFGAAVLGAALLLTTPGPSLVAGIFGGLAGGGLLLGIRYFGHASFGRAGMGMGDVKLAVVLGMLIGLDVLWALYLAIVVGGAVAATMLLVRGRMPGATLPFAPCIAVGTLVAVYTLPFSVVWGWLI